MYMYDDHKLLLLNNIFVELPWQLVYHWYIINCTHTFASLCTPGGFYHQQTAVGGCTSLDHCKGGRTFLDPLLRHRHSIQALKNQHMDNQELKERERERERKEWQIHNPSGGIFHCCTCTIEPPSHVLIPILVPVSSSTMFVIGNALSLVVAVPPVLVLLPILVPTVPVKPPWTMWAIPIPYTSSIKPTPSSTTILPILIKVPPTIPIVPAFSIAVVGATWGWWAGRLYVKRDPLLLTVTWTFKKTISDHNVQSHNINVTGTHYRYMLQAIYMYMHLKTQLNLSLIRHS